MKTHKEHSPAPAVVVSDTARTIAKHEADKSDSVPGRHVQGLIDGYEAQIAELSHGKGKHAHAHT